MGEFAQWECIEGENENQHRWENNRLVVWPMKKTKQASKGRVMLNWCSCSCGVENDRSKKRAKGDDDDDDDDDSMERRSSGHFSGYVKI